jgi:hypothetical protein
MLLRSKRQLNGLPKVATTSDAPSGSASLSSSTIPAPEKMALSSTESATTVRALYESDRSTGAPVLELVLPYRFPIARKEGSLTTSSKWKKMPVELVERILYWMAKAGNKEAITAACVSRAYTDVMLQQLYKEAEVKCSNLIKFKTHILEEKQRLGIKVTEINRVPRLPSISTDFASSGKLQTYQNLIQMYCNLLYFDVEVKHLKANNVVMPLFNASLNSNSSLSKSVEEMNIIVETCNDSRNIGGDTFRCDVLRVLWVENIDKRRLERSYMKMRSNARYYLDLPSLEYL